MVRFIRTGNQTNGTIQPDHHRRPCQEQEQAEDRRQHLQQQQHAPPTQEELYDPQVRGVRGSEYAWSGGAFASTMGVFNPKAQTLRRAHSLDQTLKQALLDYFEALQCGELPLTSMMPTQPDSRPVARD